MKINQGRLNAVTTALLVGLGASVAHAAPSADKIGQYATVHGQKIYFEKHGTGAPLILLHPGGGSISMWPEAIEYFSKDYTVLAPEQTGHGHTADDPKHPLDYHAMAEDTAELMKQQHIDSAFVLGWSDGADVALDLAVNHPTLIKKLAITGANIHGVTAPEAVAWIKAIKAECGPNDKPMETCWPPEYRDRYMKVAPDPKHFPAFLERLKALWTTEPKVGKDQLKKITSPALVIAEEITTWSMRTRRSKSTRTSRAHRSGSSPAPRTPSRRTDPSSSTRRSTASSKNRPPPKRRTEPALLRPRAA